MNRTFLPRLSSGAVLIVALTVALLGGGCDLEKQATVEKPDEPAGAPKTEPRRATATFALVSDSFSHPKDTVLRDELSWGLTRFNLGVEHEGINSRGKLNWEHESERELTVLSPNIRRIKLIKMEEKKTVQISDDEPTVESIISPLIGRTFLQDGDRVTLEGALPTSEESEALDVYSVAWIGDNALFPEAPVKRNQPWEIAPETFLKSIFNREYSKARGTVELTVLKELQYDGLRCAEVHIRIDHCQGTFKGEDGSEIELQLHGNGEILRSLEAFETVKADLRGSATIKIVSGPTTMAGPGSFELNAVRAIESP